EAAEVLPARPKRMAVPERRKVGEPLLARELRQPLVDHRGDRQPPGEIRNEPAGMRQDELDARVTLDRPREYQVDDGARRIEEIFHHESRPRQREGRARGMQARMDE